MPRAPNWLAKGGHCHAIRYSGPFVIGQDFEAPSPAARGLPRINLTTEVLNKLQACFARAEPSDAASPPGSNGGSVSDDQLFADATAYAALGNGVSEALSWYVSDYQFQPDEKDVRHQLRLLRARIDRFKSQLPQEYEALGKFIYDTYTMKFSCETI